MKPSKQANNIILQMSSLLGRFLRIRPLGWRLHATDHVRFPLRPLWITGGTKIESSQNCLRRISILHTGMTALQNRRSGV